MINLRLHMLMNEKIYCKVVESWAFRLLLQYQPHLTCVECCEVLLLHLMHEVFMLETLYRTKTRKISRTVSSFTRIRLEGVVLVHTSCRFPA